MRNSLYLFFLVFSCFSCSSDEVDNSDLIGKWKLTEAYISAGGPQYWVDIENGEEIEFFEGGVFNSDRFIECTTGNFSKDQRGLFLAYSCDEFNPISENENGLITYKLEFYSNYFVLTPTSGPICIEGCSYKYQKK